MSKFAIQGVYIIAPGEDGPCKVGVANDIAERIRMLNIGNWHDLRLAWFSYVHKRAEHVGSTPTYQRAAMFEGLSACANALEARAHREMKAMDLHIRGEWFMVTPEECIAVVEKCISKEEMHSVGMLEALDLVSYRFLSDLSIGEQHQRILWRMLENAIHASAA